MLLADGLIEGISSEWLKTMIHVLFEFAISFLAVFLILLVLVQRGRGGGIAGALGGMGGNSAFGTKAGDTFTWITYGTAAIWILLAMLTIKTFTDPPQDKARMTAKNQEDLETTDVQGIGGNEGDKESDNAAGKAGEKTPGREGKAKGKDSEASKVPAEKDEDSFPAEPAEPGDKSAPKPEGEKGAADPDKPAPDEKPDSSEPTKETSDEPK